MIVNVYRRIAIGLERANIVVFVGIVVIIKIAWNFVSKQLYFALTEESYTTGKVEIGNVFFTFFVMVIFSPPVETYITPYLFFKHLSGRIRTWQIVVLSAIVFALFHTYNVGYVFYAFFSGLIFSTCYVLRLRSNPFVTIVLIHSVYNAVGFFHDRWSLIKEW